MERPPCSEPLLALSGRIFVLRLTFAQLDIPGLRWENFCEGSVPDDGRRAFGGDIRFGAATDSGARVGENLKFPCTGLLIAWIYNGSFWQRFDLASLACDVRFNSVYQLMDVLRSCCAAVRTAAGRVCRGEVGAAGGVLYSVLPAAAGASAAGLPGSAAEPVSSELRRLVYCSRRAPGLLDGDLVSGMILPAAARNRREGITGCLYVGRLSFVQAIEGPASAVQALMRRIAADPRHLDVRVNSDVRASTRIFARWDLKVTRDDGTVDAVSLESLAQDVAAQAASPADVPMHLSIDAVSAVKGSPPPPALGSGAGASDSKPAYRSLPVSQVRIAKAIIHLLQAQAVYP